MKRCTRLFRTAFDGEVFGFGGNQTLFEFIYNIGKAAELIQRGGGELLKELEAVGNCSNGAPALSGDFADRESLHATELVNRPKIWVEVGFGAVVFIQNRADAAGALFVRRFRQKRNQRSKKLFSRSMRAELTGVGDSNVRLERNELSVDIAEKCFGSSVQEFDARREEGEGTSEPADEESYSIEQLGLIV